MSSIEQRKNEYQAFLAIAGLEPWDAIVIMESSLFIRGLNHVSRVLEISINAATWQALLPRIKSGEITGTVINEDGSRHYAQRMVLDIGGELILYPTLLTDSDMDLVDGVALQTIKSIHEVINMDQWPWMRADPLTQATVAFFLMDPPFKVPRIHIALHMLRNNIFDEDYVHPRKLGWTAGERGFVNLDDLETLSKNNSPEIPKEERLVLLKQLIGYHYNESHDDIDQIILDAFDEFCTGATCELETFDFEQWSSLHNEESTGTCDESEVSL